LEAELGTEVFEQDVANMKFGGHAIRFRNLENQQNICIMLGVNERIKEENDFESG
jgi:hypothetical protein